MRQILPSLWSLNAMHVIDRGNTLNSIAQGLFDEMEELGSGSFGMCGRSHADVRRNHRRRLDRLSFHAEQVRHTLLIEPSAFWDRFLEWLDVRRLRMKKLNDTFIQWKLRKYSDGFAN